MMQTMNTQDNILNIEVTSGFFSTCTIILRNIVGYHNGKKILPNLNISNLWNYYRDINEDISNRFFFTKEHNLNLNPEYFSTSANEDQFSDYSLINYKYINTLISEYFSPSLEVVEIKNHIISKYNLDLSNLISICYRGNDKKRETNLPTYDEMLYKLEQIKKENPSKKILIQSDEIEFCDFILLNFPDAIIFEETPKLNKSDSAIQHHIPYGSRVKNAQIFLAVMLILSESSIVILNSGNVGMWICLFRGNSNNVYQYLNPKNDPNPLGWLN